jgi:Ala-tRNA(Pro) deacylase
MALIPAAYVLVLDLIDRENPGRHRLATEDELHMMFADCTDGAIPGFAQAYNLPMIWDYALREPEELYFEGGDHQTLIRMQRSDVVRMLDDYDGLIMSCTPDHIEYYQSLH